MFTISGHQNIWKHENTLHHWCKCQKLEKEKNRRKNDVLWTLRMVAKSLLTRWVDSTPISWAVQQVNRQLGNINWLYTLYTINKINIKKKREKMIKLFETYLVTFYISYLFVIYHYNDFDISNSTNTQFHILESSICSYDFKNAKQ